MNNHITFCVQKLEVNVEVTPEMIDAGAGLLLNMIESWRGPEQAAERIFLTTLRSAQKSGLKFSLCVKENQ